jgi:hypothetical protein
MTVGASICGDTNSINLNRWTSHSLSDEWTQNYRPFIGFLTSALPDGCTIDSAFLTLRGHDKANNLTGTTPALAVVEATLASHAVITTSDYETAGTVLFSNAITYASWAATDQVFTFNAAGLAYISKTGYTDLCICEVNYDIADRLDPGNHNPNWVASKVMYMRWESTAGAPIPYLTINYTDTPPVTGAGDGAFFARRVARFGF